MVIDGTAMNYDKIIKKMAVGDPVKAKKIAKICSAGIDNGVVPMEVQFGSDARIILREAIDSAQFLSGAYNKEDVAFLADVIKLPVGLRDIESLAMIVGLK